MKIRIISAIMSALMLAMCFCGTAYGLSEKASDSAAAYLRADMMPSGGSAAARAGSKSPVISAETVSGEKGDRVKVEINMSNNPGIIALGLEISFDASRLKLVKATDGGLIGKSSSTFSDSYNSAPFVMMWEDALSSKDHTGNGTVAVLEFEVLSDPGKNGSVISVDVTDAYNYDLNDVSFSAADGKVVSSTTTTKTTTTTSKPTTTTTSKTQTTTKTTTTAKLPAIDTKISRLSGSDRVATALKISESGWKKAKNVVLAYAMNYPDALAGAPLAYALDAPILLTANKDTLEASVLAELDRLGAKNVYILGGTAAVNNKIASAIKAKGMSVERISGDSRYETAVAIAEKLVDVSGKKPKEIFVVSGVNFPDALAISSIAALKKCPILFAPATGSLDKATANFITGSKCKNVVLLGGTAAVSDGVKVGIKGLGVDVERVSGSDRYATALAIYKKYDKVFKGDGVAIATGANFPDALAGGAYAAKKGIPVILVGSSISGEMKKYVQSKDCDSAIVFGGVNAVSDQTAYSLFK